MTAAPKKCGGARKGAGRKPLPAGEAAAHRIAVYLTPTQVRILDERRGDESRSAYLARRADLTGE